MSDEILARHDAAIGIARRAGALALEFFRQGVPVETKGPLDYVTEADRAVERFIRAELARAFPGDAILGEEQAPQPGTSGFTWVIDPIDGTANFVAGIPAWCVIISLVQGEDPVSGVTFDPCHDELFEARAGHGARLNGAPIRAGEETGLDQGAVAIGLSSRGRAEVTVALVQQILAAGGLFHRNASGGLSLAYVAAGRLIGYAEQHMNAWDCLAGQLLVAEAGGRIDRRDAGRMLRSGGCVVAAAPGVYAQLCQVFDRSLAQ
jgi:myo-inositol-1(or 4)-monophosphatase